VADSVETAPDKGAPKPGAEVEKKTSAIERLSDAIYAIPLSFLNELGILATLLWRSIFWGIRPPYRLRLWVESMGA
jgi:hypothetical protein